MQIVSKAPVAVLALTEIPLESDGALSEGLNLELKSSDLVLETPFGSSPPLALARLSGLDGGGIDLLWVNRAEWLGWGLEKRLSALKSLFWTFQEAGAEQIIAAGEVQAANSVLDAGDLITPTDLIDYHRIARDRPIRVNLGPPTLATEIREQLIEAGRTRADFRLFLRGVYGSIDRPATTAELEMMAQDGVDVVGLEMGLDLSFVQSLGARYAGIYLVTDHIAGESRSEEQQDRADLQRDLSRVVIVALGRILGATHRSSL